MYGWGEIRTHGRDKPSAVFKTAALNHSATHPNIAAQLSACGYTSPAKARMQDFSAA